MKSRGYSLICTDTSQGNRLLSNFLKMKDNIFPEQNITDYHSYKFDVKIRGLDGKAASIVWHDYPGEWWQFTKEGFEANEKIETFRSLLQEEVKKNNYSIESFKESIEQIYDITHTDNDDENICEF